MKTVKLLLQKMAQLIDERKDDMVLRKDYVSLKIDYSLAQEMADKYFYSENIKIEVEKEGLTESEIKIAIKETFNYLGKWIYVFWFLSGVLVTLLINKYF